MGFKTRREDSFPKCTQKYIPLPFYCPKATLWSHGAVASHPLRTWVQHPLPLMFQDDMTA
eukprot:1565155-Amphidinium_carterae.1